MSIDLGDQLLRTERGSYALYAPVASGGFGTVYFGRDLQTNRAVAIKRLHGHLAYQPDVVARFQQEAQRLRGLQHPNIVQVLDDGTDSRGLPFIILEWVEGWTVDASLEQSGRFAIADAVEIACQVLAALEAAGRRGVVHRDIKPANLMVTPPPDRRVKVMDFGIAKDVLANAGSQYTQIGTIAYMAPEQFTQGAVDARTDLYALGVTLYELLTGQRPKGALTPESLTSLRELRPEVDPALAAIVYRALEKRPADRFENAAQMRAALEPFVSRGVDLTVLGVGPTTTHVASSQAQIGELYAAANQAVVAQAWPTAIQLLNRIHTLDPAFDDPAGLGNTAKTALTAEQRRTSVEGPPSSKPSDAQARTEFVERPTRQETSHQKVPRRNGTLIWAVGGVGLVGLLAIGGVALSSASGQIRLGSDTTPVPVAQSTDVPPAPVALVVPTEAPATESPRVATPLPPTAVPTSPAATATAAPTLTIAPTATPTVDDLWRVALGKLDPTWSHDWPGSIEVLRAFLQDHPGFVAGEEKLYAAYLFYADQLLETGDVDGAVKQLEAGNALMPQRTEAKLALVALTPTPTAAPAAPQFAPKPQPAAPTQPRTQPIPAQQPAAPAPAPAQPRPAPPPLTP
jgi:serine/threonine protein kinase